MSLICRCLHCLRICRYFLGLYCIGFHCRDQSLICLYIRYSLMLLIVLVLIAFNDVAAIALIFIDVD